MNISPTSANAPHSQDSSSTFSKARSKLAFDRLVALGAKMGMPNPLFLCADRAAKATIHINGNDYINFSTYDYLDINGHPEITAAVTKAAETFGTSAGASRLVGGERTPHRELESAIARFLGTEDCIVYVSGHATNVSTIGFFFGSRDLILYDNLAHNSLAQGARLSNSARFAYAHNDCNDLERLLKAKRGEYKRAVIVTEGLFSMDGNIPDIPHLIELKKRYDLVPNLVETVKGYAAHESSTLEAVISARNEAVTAEGREAKDSADRGLRSALSRLFALSESYPDLKANQNFLSLQDDMRDIETSILNARKYYNAVVREYNDSIMVFPSSLIASVFHFRKKEYVEIDDAHKESIRVEF